jgi:hypothetical protein
MVIRFTYVETYFNNTIFYYQLKYKKVKMTTTYKNYSSDIEKIEQLKQLSSTYQLVMTKIKQLES